ncbi:MAG: helix-turn-helix transcriptional regulator [Ruminococcus sp.]|nr:helix-turn-helix transcriptional regulator [Ruminococcus sp.]
MQIGEVIRKHRKLKNLTQEEMAVRLGVTAPAVNKWENGNSFPDIMLLAPIARLLGITVDTLLSFREELTAQEIGNIIYEMERKLKEESYEDVFQWARKKIEEYPNCEQLIWQTAVYLDTCRFTKQAADQEKYDAYILDCYNRALGSREESIRNQAANCLFGFYMRKEQYEKAEEYLQYFSIQSPERKRKQAQIYEKTGRPGEAARVYEEILYGEYMILSGVLQGLCGLAMGEEDMERAHMLVDKQKALARLFEMGKYQEVFCGLELAAREKDTEAVLGIMEEMLADVGEMGSVCQAPLYAHMTFKEAREEFLTEMKENLKKGFREDECFAFLKEEPRYKKMLDTVTGAPVGCEQ